MVCHVSVCISTHTIFYHSTVESKKKKPFKRLSIWNAQTSTPQHYLCQFLFQSFWSVGQHLTRFYLFFVSCFIAVEWIWREANFLSWAFWKVYLAEQYFRLLIFEQNVLLIIPGEFSFLFCIRKKRKIRHCHWIGLHSKIFQCGRILSDAVAL